MKNCIRNYIEYYIILGGKKTFLAFIWSINKWA